jgi:DNA-binding HxlR family transcriptional regulator
VVRELLLGAKRFNQLRRGLPGPSPNVLSQRLRELEQAGIVRRYQLDPPASVIVYELTERGRELEPVLLELGRWGSQAPITSSSELSPDALLVALKTTFAPTRAGELVASWGLRLDGVQYRIRVADGRLDIALGTATAPSAYLDTYAATLRSVIFGGLPMREATADGRLTIDGPRRAVSRLIRLFPAPARRAG